MSRKKEPEDGGSRGVKQEGIDIEKNEVLQKVMEP